MGNAQKRHTPEFKQKAVELLRSSDATAAEVARGLGIDPSTLRGWAKGAGAPAVPKGQNPFQASEEPRRLRRENERLRRENEILLLNSQPEWR